MRALFVTFISQGSALLDGFSIYDLGKESPGCFHDVDQLLILQPNKDVDGVVKKLISTHRYNKAT